MLPANFLRKDRPLVWGHRGASFDAPENTHAAFALAARQGADGIELDAQLCASGEVVVMHDESLGRTAGFAGLVTQTPWSVLKTLDAGRGERIPLLADVLTSFRGLINVELKCDVADDRGLTAAVAKLLRGHEDRVLLSSFNPLCLLRARMLAPRVARAWLFEDASSRFWAPALGVRALHPHAPLATPARVKRWRLFGYSVACWTVDDPDVAARLWDSGVSGIITNRPDVMRARFG